MRIKVILDDKLRRKLGVFIAYAIVENVKVMKSDVKVEKFLSKVVEEACKKFSIDSIKENPIIRAYRDFYWRIGIDPTKQRPSSEALLRRVLRYKGIPLINNIVDAGNIASIETLVPIGIYDIDKIGDDTLILRYANSGEVFKGIGGKVKVLRESDIVLASSKGKILHLYPYRDSVETMITDDTSNILVIGAGVPNVDKSLVLKAVEKTVDYVLAFGGGKVTCKPTIVV